MSETSTLIEKLGLDKDAIYKCVRRADCSNCLCDDVRYSKCQLITSWGKFSREYSSLMALLLERLSEKMEDKDKTDWHVFPEEKPKEDDLYIVTINESFNGRSLTSASWWDSRGEQFTDFEDSAVAAWAYMPRPYKKEIL